MDAVIKVNGFTNFFFLSKTSQVNLLVNTTYYYLKAFFFLFCKRLTIVRYAKLHSPSLAINALIMPFLRNFPLQDIFFYVNLTKDSKDVNCVFRLN